MPAVFSRLKNWVAEKLTYADLNAEIDNILDNFEPAQMDDYSTNTTVMRQQTDPGEVGTESPATTLAGELERLRYSIKEAKGTTYWYESPASSIASIFDQLGSTTLATRIISGKVRSGSSQSDWLRADGGGVTGTLSGSVTNLVYQINSTEYTISTNPQVTGLSTAPNSNNTALVDDVGAADSGDTKFLGEFGSSLIVDNMGTEIVGLVGKYAAFKINDGSNDEYFMAYVKSSTELTQITRGAFFNTSGNPVPRLAIANNDTITLLKANWIFAKADGTLTFSAGFPRVSAEQPSGSAANDYWFDTTTEIWKKYDGAAYVDAEACLVGLILCDSANSVASLSFDISKEHSDVNTIQLEKISNSEVRAVSVGSRVSVFGSLVEFGNDLPRWDMANDLDSGVTEAASTEYFLYLDEDGKSIISDVCPRDLSGTRRGLYHPYHTWRCVGSLWNDASSNIECALHFSDTSESNYRIVSAVAANALTVRAIANPLSKFALQNSDISVAEPMVASILPGTSLTVSSGSTLGTVDARAAFLIVHGLLHSNRLELGISQSPHKNNSLATSTAEGGAGGADNAGKLYTYTARTDAPVRILAKLGSTQASAGTWATAVDSYAIWPFSLRAEIHILSSTTYTIPYGHGIMDFQLFGGGGGGGGSGSSDVSGRQSGGGGGGGGAIPVMVRKVVVPGDDLTITIGAGGSAGAGGVGAIANGSTGGDGTATTVDGTNIDLVAPGGAGGGGGGYGAAAGNTGSTGRTSPGYGAPGGAGGAASGPHGGGGGGGGGAGPGGVGCNANTGSTPTGQSNGGGGGGGGIITSGASGATSEYNAATPATSGSAQGGGGGSSYGIGGNGGASNAAGTAAAANTGAGGGGGGSRTTGTTNGYNGAAGGSGRAIIIVEV